MISYFIYDIIFHIWYHHCNDVISHMIIMNDDVLLLAGLRGDSCTLPEQSKSGRIFQHQLVIKTDFDIQGNGLEWYALPQLFFNCTLCPTGAKERSGSHKEVSLVYFSPFEPIKLTSDSVMQRAGVPMLYDSASNPRLILSLFMISYIVLWYHRQYHIHDIMHDIAVWCYATDFMILQMISYIISYDIMCT